MANDLLRWPQVNGVVEEKEKRNYRIWFTRFTSYRQTNHSKHILMHHIIQFGLNLFLCRPLSRSLPLCIDCRRFTIPCTTYMRQRHRFGVDGAIKNHYNFVKEFCQTGEKSLEINYEMSIRPSRRRWNTSIADCYGCRRHRHHHHLHHHHLYNQVFRRQEIATKQKVNNFFGKTHRHIRRYYLSFELDSHDMCEKCQFF